MERVTWRPQGRLTIQRWYELWWRTRKTFVGSLEATTYWQRTMKIERVYPIAIGPLALYRKRKIFTRVQTHASDNGCISWMILQSIPSIVLGSIRLPEGVYDKKSDWPSCNPARTMGQGKDKCCSSWGSMKVIQVLVRNPCEKRYNVVSRW